MYQAITTKYIGPTNHRAGRIKAKAFGGSLTVEWDHALNPDANHAAAAKALANKMDWAGVWYAGGMPDGAGNCFVCAPEHGKAVCAFITEHRVLTPPSEQWDAKKTAPPFILVNYNPGRS